MTIPEVPRPELPPSDQPGKEDLLDAVARFLQQDVLGAVSDPGLAFRLRVAANLVGLVARECRQEEAQADQEFARYRALFPGQPPFPTELIEHRRNTLRDFQRRLAERLRGEEEEWSDEALAAVAKHLRASLQAELAIVNPRFDTRLEIE